MIKFKRNVSHDRLLAIKMPENKEVALNQETEMNQQTRRTRSINCNGGRTIIL